MPVGGLIGVHELLRMPLALDLATVPEIPFSKATLATHQDTHVLVFTPERFADGTPITINALRGRFGVDPAASEPCMYNQDWYVNESFAAGRSADGQWHLLRREVIEAARAKPLAEIEASLPAREELPTAITVTFAFFAHWFATGGRRLWNHDFVWCADRDHNNDRIYVGRYEDPAGVNGNGFNIHRHLAVTAAYSAAPEIVTG